MCIVIHLANNPGLLVAPSLCHLHISIFRFGPYLSGNYVVTSRGNFL